MLPGSFFLAAWTAAVVTATPTIDCRTVSFPVSVSAENENFGNDFDPQNASSIDGFVTQALNTGTVGINGTILTSGSFAISAQYCAPSGAPTQPTNIQILVHGNTCNHTIWDALGQQDLQQAGYSWQRFAAIHGHATLALDMIGHGASTIPDPNTVVQMPIEAAIINEIATSLRSDKNVLGCAFEKVIFVGHSYGSVSGIATARFFPTFADVLVLTGWSAFVPLPDPLLLLQMHSASLLFDRFENLPLGYITGSNKTGHAEIFYGGDFDPTIPETSFALQDIMTTGEGGSIGEGLQPAGQYLGKVLVVTGGEDVLFCNPTNGPCAEQLINSTVLVPNATEFETRVIPNTGHNFMLHHSSQSTFELVQGWLDQNL
jgi:pimeloyl-ACP methyl ester carboxylesterase